jgi:hypothetical protein
VKEGYPVAPGPGAGLLVDELDAVLPEAGQDLGEVGDTIGDVVQARDPGA